MKSFMRKAAVFVAAAGILFFESSCDSLFNMQIPETVSVKTSAEYTVSLGNASFDMSSVFSVDDILDTLRETLGDGTDVYEYIDSSQDVLTYVIHKTLFDYDLDVGSMLGDLDIDSMLADSSATDSLAIDQQVELPSVSLDQSMTIDFGDIVSDIQAKALASPGDVTITDVPESDTAIGFGPGSVPDGMTMGVATVTNDYADSVTLGAGSKLKVTVTRTDGNALDPSFVFSLGIVIADANGTIAQADPAVVTDGGSFTVDLGGKTLPKGFGISPVGAISGGSAQVPPVTHDYTLSLAFEDSCITKITNLTPAGDPADPSDDIAISPVSIDRIEVGGIEIPSLISSATIASGGGSIAMKAGMPDGWSGVSLTFDTLAVEGLGLSVDGSGAGDANSSGALIDKTLDLGGQSLDSGSGTSLTVDATVSLDLAGATLDFGSDGTQNTSIALSITGGITRLSEVIIDAVALGSGIPTESSHEALTVDLPEELKKFVSAISFGEQSGGVYYKTDSDGDITATKSEGIGIKAKVVNSLPEGNNIPVYIKSAAFGLDGSLAFDGTGSTAQTEVSCISYQTLDVANTDTISLEYYLPDVLTLSDLSMGASYTLGLRDVSLVFDWDSATIDLTALTDGDALLEIKADDEINTSLKDIDLQQMIDDIEDETLRNFLKDTIETIGMKGLDVFFYAQKPTGAFGDVLENDVSFVADSLQLTYDGTSGANKTFPILDGDIRFVDPISWPSSEQVSQIKDTSDFAKNLSKDHASVAVENLAEVVTDLPKNMTLTGKITLGGSASALTIRAAAIDALSSEDTTKIAIDMAAKIPLSLTLKKPVTFEPLSLLDDWKDGDDLLQREDASTFEEYADYADMIQYVRLSYDATNNVMPGAEIVVTITDEKSGLNKTITIKGGSQSLDFTGEEVKAVMTSYPFHPQITVRVGRALTDEEAEAGDSYASGKEVSLAVSRKAFDSGAKSLGADVRLTVKMNGDAPITVWGGKN